MIAVVLAAGKGVRMKSARPKVLHPVCGRPMLRWVIDAVRKAGASRVIVVVSPGATAVQDVVTDCEFAVQTKQRGTGDALLAAATLLKDAREPILVVCGDTPLLRNESIERLLAAYRRGPIAMLTFRTRGPAHGYGRVVRDGRSRVVKVVEEKDATVEEKVIDEANAGAYLLDAKFLQRTLPTLRPSHASGEVYLTDLIAIAAKSAGDAGVATAQAAPAEALGINDRAQLARVQRLLCARFVRSHQQEGVTFEAPNEVYLEHDVQIGADTVIGRDVELRGATAIGKNCRIATGSVLTNVTVGDQVTFLPYCVATDSTIADGARVGPFAHLRPGSEIGASAHIGNFVETKKARFGRGAKANHLAYLGDADIGDDVNIGAGTITCNYDGYVKHKTTIENGAFIGSDSQLVAPVRIGRNAYVGAGATITRDVPAGALALTRAPLKIVIGYAERKRASSQSEIPASKNDKGGKDHKRDKS